MSQSEENSITEQSSEEEQQKPETSNKKSVNRKRNDHMREYMKNFMKKFKERQRIMKTSQNIDENEVGNDKDKNDNKEEKSETNPNSRPYNHTVTYRRKFEEKQKKRANNPKFRNYEYKRAYKNEFRRIQRLTETPEEKETRLKKDRDRTRIRLQRIRLEKEKMLMMETPEQKAARLIETIGKDLEAENEKSEKTRIYHKKYTQKILMSETPEEREARLKRRRESNEHTRKMRSLETREEKLARLKINRHRRNVQKQKDLLKLNLLNKDEDVIDSRERRNRKRRSETREEKLARLRKRRHNRNIRRQKEELLSKKQEEADLKLNSLNEGEELIEEKGLEEECQAAEALHKAGIIIRKRNEHMIQYMKEYRERRDAMEASENNEVCGNEINRQDQQNECENSPHIKIEETSRIKNQKRKSEQNRALEYNRVYSKEYRRIKRMMETPEEKQTRLKKENDLLRIRRQNKRHENLLQNHNEPSIAKSEEGQNKTQNVNSDGVNRCEQNEETQFENETPEEQEAPCMEDLKLERVRKKMQEFRRRKRMNETPEEREARLKKERDTIRIRRQNKRKEKLQQDRNVRISLLDKIRHRFNTKQNEDQLLQGDTQPKHCFDQKRDTVRITTQNKQNEKLQQDRSVRISLLDKIRQRFSTKQNEDQLFQGDTQPKHCFDLKQIEMLALKQCMEINTPSFDFSFIREQDKVSSQQKSLCTPNTNMEKQVIQNTGLEKNSKNSFQIKPIYKPVHIIENKVINKGGLEIILKQASSQQKPLYTPAAKIENKIVQKSSREINSNQGSLQMKPLDRPVTVILNKGIPKTGLEIILQQILSKKQVPYTPGTKTANKVIQKTGLEIISKQAAPLQKRLHTSNKQFENMVIQKMPGHNEEVIPKHGSLQIKLLSTSDTKIINKVVPQTEHGIISELVSSQIKPLKSSDTKIENKFIPETELGISKLNQNFENNDETAFSFKYEYDFKKSVPTIENNFTNKNNISRCVEDAFGCMKEIINFMAMRDSYCIYGENLANKIRKSGKCDKEICIAKQLIDNVIKNLNSDDRRSEKR